MRIRWTLVMVAVLAVLPSSVLAQGEPPTVLYHLQPGSTYEEGCYGQCLCPILQAPLEGTFGLTLLPTAGPLPVWAVEEINFVVPPMDKSIEGSGFYTRAGELNQMGLDLEIDDGAAQHFGSGGFVPDGAEFPDIDIVVSVNQMSSCFDYVLHLVASPGGSQDSWPVLDVSMSELSWSAVTGATGYDVVCGDLQALRSSGDFAAATDLCLGDDHEQTSLSYDLTPEDGEAVWFLVRQDGGSYESGGESQAGSRDDAINASAPACP